MISEDFLDEELILQFQFPVLDGITNSKFFFSSRERILWILKEANDTEAEKSWNQRDFHKDIRSYPSWKQTYAKIVQASHGILNQIWNFDDLPSVDSLYSTMHHIAMINLKKVGGNSRAKIEEINESATGNFDLIKRQITGINPTIIIHGYNNWDLFKAMVPETKHKYIGNTEYALHDGVKHINVYHPNSTKDNRANYFAQIIHAYKDI